MFPHIVRFKVKIMRRLISVFPHIVLTKIITCMYLLAMLTRLVIVENNVSTHSTLLQNIINWTRTQLHFFIATCRNF